MHGIGAEQPVDGLGFDGLGREGQGGQLGQPDAPGGVARHQQPADAAVRVVERRLHRVQAVQPDQPVRCRLAGRGPARAALGIAVGAPQPRKVAVLRRGIAVVRGHGVPIYSRSLDGEPPARRFFDPSPAGRS